MVETPVLIATFARPEYARKTFDAIKKAKPKKLYFYSNKAREDNPEEIKRNKEVRALVKEIDWDCELKTWFRDEYVDVFTSLWGAYDWVFDNEEQAIILEEDCVASLAFFDFCDQLLPKYKDDLRVWLISGNNFIEGYNPSGYDYIFSKFPYLYGWASWSSRWNSIYRNGFPKKEVLNNGIINYIYPSNKYRKISKEIFKRNIDAWTNIWDYSFTWTMKLNHGFGIIPIKNLVKNIGIDGFHNKQENKLYHNRKLYTKQKYNIIKTPPYIAPDYRYDMRFLKIIYKSPVKNRLKRIIKKIIYGN